MNLSTNTQVDQILGYSAAGQVKTTSDIINMSGYEGVLFVVELGTLLETGTLDAYVEQNTINSVTGMARLATTTVHTVTAANALLAKSCILVDVWQPREQFLQCNITPGVANAVILGITAIRYRGTKRPSGSVTALKSTALQSPNEA